LGKGKKTSREIKEKIIKLRKEGLTRDIIKERLGVSDWQITKTLQESKNE
jgi:hypothetical protein